MSRIFFIADLHFYHRNIMLFEEGRSIFETIEEMNEELIRRWNLKIAPQDDVYILGDLSFGSVAQTIAIVKRLNGNKHLIYGNHDRPIQESKTLQSMFCWCKDYYVLKTINPRNGEKIKIVLFHYPISVWEAKHYGSLHCYGHVHSNKGTHHPLTEDLGSNAFNVGIDVNDLSPTSLEELLDKQL